ncbi:hypothetical protein PHMEG_00018161 [Phytophthora megakarya]|uniref:TKL protein kinase n=1 Tax=Phytophthora megakarya TaxID=4795 RepID=A0A225VW07_9STRA|nr:hypothetical protein PHMEG_00018161 [Phytophthora megakarya]
MKADSVCVYILALGSLLSSTSTSSSTVTAKEINADPGCTGRTTTIYSTITEDVCRDGMTCTPESGWTNSVSSEYKFCNYDQAGYLRYAFPNVQYLLFEYFEDNECKTLIQSSAILADGKCHSSVHYTLMFKTGDDGTAYVLSRGIDCDRGPWSNFTEPIPKTMINTGKCFVGEHTIAKVYLVNGSTSSSTSTSANTSVATSATNGRGTANTTASSSAMRTTLSMLILAIASTFAAI